MQQRLVAWGDIGTDHKALIAVEYVAADHKVIFRAIPEEVVDKEIQNNIFLNWKNGGDFVFPDDVPIFEVPADSENLLPEGIKLHKPELLVSAQRQWNKIQELADNFKVLGEKLHILELELDNINEFNQDLWNKTKSLWDEISEQKKEGHLGWAQADELKIRINSVFDGLKAFRRLNKEKNFDESNALFKLFEKQISECEEKLIYPDEWNKIFNSLKNIQKEMKEAPLLFKHQRNLYNKINGVFGDLRNYRKSDQINHVQERISGLERVLYSINQSIERDEKSYKNQFEKMKHYTRGKMSDEDIATQLKYLKDQAKVKQKKIKSIEKTLRSLDNKIESLKNPPKPPPKAKPKKEKQPPVETNETEAAKTEASPEKAVAEVAKKSEEKSEEKSKKKSEEGKKKKSKDKAVPAEAEAKAVEAPRAKAEAAPEVAEAKETVETPEVIAEAEVTPAEEIAETAPEAKEVEEVVEVVAETEVAPAEEIPVVEAEAETEVAEIEETPKVEAETETTEVEEPVAEEIIEIAEAVEPGEASEIAAETETVPVEEVIERKVETEVTEEPELKNDAEVKEKKPAKKTKAKAKPKPKVSSKS